MEHNWPKYFQPDVVHEGFGGKLTSYTITLEAWRRGLKVTYTSPHLGTYRIENDAGRSITFLRSRPSLTSDHAVDLVNDKYETLQILKSAKVPTPQSKLIDLSIADLDTVKTHARELGYPVVLKPLRGSMGRGVFAGIQNPDVLARRFEDLKLLTRGNFAVIESHVFGDDYRVLVVGDRCAGVCKRIPANITGDGKTSVEQLITEKNSKRSLNPFLAKGLIKPDHEVSDFLATRGYDLNSVPLDGEYIQLRSAANASAGGDVIDVTDEIPEAIKQAAIKAVKVVPGLFCAGVDVLYSPKSKEADLSYSIIELNAHPQIGVNMYPTKGDGQDAPRHFLDACFPQSSRNPSEADSKLTISLEDLLWPIRTGIASEVTLKPLPDHRFAVRKCFRLEVSQPITKLTKNRLRRTARNHDVAGVYRSDETHDTLMIAGSAEGVSSYLTIAEKLLKTTLRNGEDWHGPVSSGFQFA